MSQTRDQDSPLAFTRAYALVSLVAIIATAVVLSVLYRELSVRTIVEFGEQANATVARTALNAVRPELVEFLADRQSGSATAPGDRVPQWLSGLVTGAVRDTPVERIKIYDRHGLILYSTRGHETGADDSSNPRFQQAIAGEISSQLRYRDVFNLFELPDRDDNLIETYIPIREPGNRQPIGVFEIYTDVSSVVRSMARNELLILAGIVTILIVLYGLLLAVVRRAHGIINSQRQAIVERNRTLQVLSARMLAADEGERRRVAWELHEEVAQTLSAVKMKMEALANAAAQSQGPSAAPSADEIVPLVQDAIGDLRAIAMDLRPPALDDFGLIAAIRWLCREAEHRDAGGLNVRAEITAREADIPDLLKSVIFRVVHQTLRRLARMPRISDIRVALTTNEHPELVVEFGPASSEQDCGEKASETDSERPMATFWERIVLAGGTFTVTHSGSGRCVYRAFWSL